MADDEARRFGGCCGEEPAAGPPRLRGKDDCRTDSSDDCCSGLRQDGCCGAEPAGDRRAMSTTPTEGRSFQVAGLDCAEEVAILKKAVGPRVGGEKHLAFDAMNGRMTVFDSAEPISDDAIIKAVAGTGMSAKPWDPESAGSDHAAHMRRQKLWTGLSGAFWLAGLAWHVAASGAGGALSLFAGHNGEAMPLGEIVLFLAAILFGVRFVAPKALHAARRLAPDMNLLMVVAVIGAIGIGELFEAATVAFLFSLSLTLESWSVGRARHAVASLLDLAPQTARVIRPDGSEEEIPAEEVAIGDRFVARGGDRIPLDGEVVEGRSGVNQAPITGESALATKEPGHEVFAGTINGEGALTVRATKAADDTVLARIIRMVGEAHARRAPVEQWVERFARVYTPAVMGLAVLVAIVPPLAFGGAWGQWFYNALVLLVIACPCALVISTPVSIVAGLAASARQGVLVKGGAYLEMPARLTALAMDKTGTLTLGEPEVAAVHPADGVDEQSLLSVAAALEARSSHPLAAAILAEAEARGIPGSAASETKVVPGRGLEGRRNDMLAWLGSERFAREKGHDGDGLEPLIEHIEARGATAVLVGDGKRLLGVIEIRDKVRGDARAVIAGLHELGVRKIVMLTGDNKATAVTVAREVGIDEVRAEILPEDKVAAVEELAAEHPVVAMIGDGVNDAPAMARAHFGIAMGAIGSDAAIETADIALMTDDIAKVPWLVDHSRRTMAVIRQNICFALGVKLVFVVLTALSLATLWGAIAADVGATLLVTFNALRLLRPKAVSQRTQRTAEPSVEERMATGALTHGH